MKKIVRMSSVEEHDAHRREDVARMSPSERVLMALEMQSRACGWDKNPTIKRVAKIRRMRG